MAVSVLLLLTCLSMLCLFSGTASFRQHTEVPFRNTSLPWSVRVDDLVNRLTIDEIIEQMAKGGAGKEGGPSPGITRLGIKSFQWITECLRGDAYDGNATSFPQSIGLGATFNKELLYEIATATGKETRARNNYYVSKGITADHTGITCFSPLINIMRHPLWGRNQETYGEDPYLIGRLSQQFVSGLQGNHPRYALTSATCKHLSAYAGPDNYPIKRYAFDAKVSERDWHSTFLAMFKWCVRANPLGVMCSYNSVNGVPSCVNKRAMTDVLRKKFGFRGFVISDEGAIQVIVTYHKYLNNTVDTAAAAVNAGVNIEISDKGFGEVTLLQLGKALKQGKVTRQTLLDRVKPLFYTRMRLGEFDPPLMNPYRQYTLDEILTPGHIELATQAAMQSFVLLKNDKNFLPLLKRVPKLAIVGPMADDKTQIMGDYAANTDPRFVITPRKGLSGLGDDVAFAAGCQSTHCTNYSSSSIKVAVTSADLVIVCLGTGQAEETEEHDRRSLSLPGHQIDLLKDVLTHSGDAPVILLLLTAGPVDISLALSSPRVPVIMQCWFPAQSAGEAMRRVLTNDGAGSNPGGRLPYTWYKSLDQVPPITDYSMVNKTYRYFPGDPALPFGYGLSYTNFTYSSIAVAPSIVKAGHAVTVSVKLQNTGLLEGDEVVQLYMSWLQTNSTVPRLQLVGFERVRLRPGEYYGMSLTIEGEQMAVWKDGVGFVVEPGKMRVYAGGQQPNQKVKLSSNVLQTTFTIQGVSVDSYF